MAALGITGRASRLRSRRGLTYDSLNRDADPPPQAGRRRDGHRRISTSRTRTTRRTARPNQRRLGPVPRAPSRTSASSLSPSQSRARNLATGYPASSAEPSTRLRTATSRPSPISCSESPGRVPWLKAATRPSTSRTTRERNSVNASRSTICRHFLAKARSRSSTSSRLRRETNSPGSATRSEP